MAEHDQSYKQLFSYPRMIEDLLIGFVREDWVSQLNFETLEKVNASFVSETNRQREADMIWRVRMKDTWLYVYLLLEFQSSVDRTMALRMMTYIGLFYQDLAKSSEYKDKEHLLPPVLPLVLYNGQDKWKVSCDMSGIVAEAPGELKKYQVKLKYLLIDEGRLKASTLAIERNLAAVLFRLEKSGTPSELKEAMTVLMQWLGDTRSQGLKRAFITWLKRIALPRRFPKIVFKEMQELQEVNDMLAERMTEWTKEWETHGYSLGVQDGVQQRARDDILDILMTRFDAAPQDIADVLQNITDDVFLKSLFRLAIKSKSIEEFRQHLQTSNKIGD